MMGMVTSSYDIAAMIITPLISYIGGSRKKPVFCAWGVFTMGAGFFIFMLPHFVSPPYEAGMSIMIGRSSLAYEAGKGTFSHPAPKPGKSPWERG